VQPTGTEREASTTGERKALIVVNRRGTGGRRSLDRAIHHLEDAGLDVSVTFSRDPSGIPALVRQLAPAADLVIIGGGDGTLSAALPAVLAAGKPLGILPMGNANDLARTLGLPDSLPAAAAIIAAGRKRRIDLGTVNGRPFLNVASLGLSVEIARRLTPQRKQRWRLLAYLGCAWEAFHRQRSFQARIHCAGETHTLRCLQVCVGNGRYYGGGMAIAHDAAIDDGRLDCFALPKVLRWRLLVLVPALRRGTHRPVLDILSLNSDAIEIETDPPMAVNVDGEVVETTPARFGILPKALVVYGP